MDRIELTSTTRSNRTPWAWTKRVTIPRSDDILEVFKELRRWWPVTERQVYYRLISSDLSKQDHWRKSGNPEKPFCDYYKAICRTLKWMRIDEKLPWNAIIDEHRMTTPKIGFENKEEFIEYEFGQFLAGYGRCMAQKQSYYLEVWIEKAALLHIVKPIADKFCRRVVVCRGYNSVTFQADFYRRATDAMDLAQTPAVLYFGDWDPSGVNMFHAAIQTLEDELGLYGVEYYRCGINPEHFDDLAADPVPIKPRDSRAKKFIKQHGSIAYELDAFHPQKLQDFVSKCIESFTDMEAYSINTKQEEQDYDDLENLKDYMLEAFDNYNYK